MPPLTKVYFLDNMVLLGPTFFVFLSLLCVCVFFFPPPSQNPLYSFMGLKVKKKKVCVWVGAVGRGLESR